MPHVRNLFLIEFVGYETFAFFVVYWLFILFLPRFGYSRFKLHMADITLEIVLRKGYGYFVFGTNKPPPEGLVSRSVRIMCTWKVFFVEH